MNKYNIISNGVSLDTYDNLNISLNYQLEDINNISQRPSNWSYTIALPGRPINNKFFKHIFDCNIDAITFNPNKKIETIISSDENIIFNGYLQLTELFVNQGDVEYNVVVSGELINAVNKMGDALLTDLVDLSEFNHIRNQSNIVDSMDYNIVINDTLTQLEGPGRGYVYPDIVYGGSTNITNTKLIYEMYPAVYVKSVVEKLFDTLGYKIKSDFLNTDYFKKLILPFINDKFQLTEEEVLKKKMVVGIPYTTTPVPVTGYRDHGSGMLGTTDMSMFSRNSGEVDESGSELIFTDVSDLFTENTGTLPVSVYTNEVAGWYNISFLGKMFARYNHIDGNDIEYKADSGAFKYRYFLYLVRADGTEIMLDGSGAGVNLEFTPSSGSHPTPWFDVANPIDANMNADNVWLALGDKVFVRIDFEYPDSVHWVGLLNDDKIKAQLVFEDFSDNQFSKFMIVPVDNQSMGNEYVNMNQVLPNNVKAVDFIGSLVKMFRLIITEDKNDPTTLIIEPIDDYYSSSIKVLEWDDKLENNLDYKITPMSELDVTKYLYTYQSDDDYLNKEYTDETKKIYSEFIIDVDNDFSNKTDKTDIIFAPTPNGQEFIDNRVAPFFVERVENDFKIKRVKPRILFYGGTIDCNAIQIKDSIPALTSTTITKYPYTGMWDHPTSPMYDLGFGRTDKIYWNTNVFPTQTLYERFHKSTINNIINPNSRLFEGMFYLTSRDIAEFDFRNVVFLLGSYWRVLEIKDYNPISSDGLTKVVLNKITNVDVLSPLTIKVPTSNGSCPVDVQTVRIGRRYVHQSASGLPITEDCCNSLNGNYVDGTCYIGEIKLNPIDHVASSAVGAPTTSPGGPISSYSNENTINSPGVIVKGTGNIIGYGISASTMILGNNNTIDSGIQSSVVIGNNINATQSDTLYTNNIEASTINGVSASYITAGLPGVLSIDNTTGGNDIIINVTDAIKDVTGNAIISLASDTIGLELTDNTNYNSLIMQSYGVVPNYIITNIYNENLTGTAYTEIVETIDTSTDEAKIFLTSQSSLGNSKIYIFDTQITEVSKSILLSSDGGTTAKNITIDNSSIKLKSANGVTPILNDILTLDYNSFKINYVPTTVNTNTKLLTRNATTGEVEMRDVSSLPGGSDTNFADTDLTFTGDRFHDADGYQLNIENTPHLHVSGVSGSAVRMIIDAPNATDPKILSWRTNNSQRFAIRVDAANDDIAFRCYDNTGTFTIAPIKVERATGQVEISEAFKLPVVDGSANQVLKTDGSGNTSWTTVSAPLETIGTVTGTSSITNDITLVNNTVAVTMTLPTAVGLSGKKYTIKSRNANASTKNITIATTSSQTIDGSLTYVIGVNYESITVVSDGSNWWII